MTPSTQTRDLLALISRVLLAVLFIPAGIEKIPGFAGTVHYISAHNVPLPELAAVIGIVIELGLGVLLLVGYQTRWVALVFIVYCIVLAFIFHAYWSAPAAQALGAKINFYKNVGLAGGFFSILAWGAGGWSVDARRGAARSDSLRAA